MLATTYDADGAVLPCVVQPKLDGVRLMLELRNDGSVGRMRSRAGSDFSHLRESLGLPDRARCEGGVVLDGELYVHGLGFQNIVSAARTRGRGPRDTPIEYHVYDAWIPSKPDAALAERLARVSACVRCLGGQVREVASIGAGSAAAVRNQLSVWLRRGYEGIMVRDPAAPYQPGKRSRALAKLKPFEDAEFVIVGYEEATGKDRGTVVYTCRTDDGSKFSVRPRGTLVQRARMLREASSVIGKKLTVRFQGRTDSGIPRFPVGIAVRDYE